MPWASLVYLRDQEEWVGGGGLVLSASGSSGEKENRWSVEEGSERERLREGRGVGGMDVR